MSLRKSTSSTPRRVDAARHNAQRSTGPRSEAGKERMRMNALKHGCDAAPENEAAVMRALGEDPERCAALKRELATAYGPGDTLWDRQTEDLAKLYWRRQRIERMETGLMRDALEAVEERRRVPARALAEVTFEPSQCEAVALELPKPNHPLVRLRMLISLWGVIRDEVRRRVFTLAQQNQIERYYRGELGWRPRQIGHLLGLFMKWAYLHDQQDHAELDKYVKEGFGSEAGVEARSQELLLLLEEQMAAVEAAFTEEMKAQEEKDAIARDSCLAPEDETANMVLRLEMALDRAIDRKVRILLTMRKEHAQEAHTSRQKPSGRMRHPSQPEASPPDNASNDREAQELSKLVGLEPGRDTPSSVCDSGQGSEAPPSLRETPTPNGGGLRQPTSATQTESPKEGNAREISKCAEQSQNVIENEGPAAEEVKACGAAGLANWRRLVWPQTPESRLASKVLIKLRGEVSQ